MNENSIFMDYVVEHLSSTEISRAIKLSTISAELAKARIEKGMNQKEFASFMGVSQGMVSKWESGDYNFSVATLIDIAEKIGYDFDVTLHKPSADIVEYVMPRWNYNNQRSEYSTKLLYAG